MVIITPVPDAFRLRCQTCGAGKQQLDGNDDVTVSEDWNIAKGTWFCPNGHPNRI